MCNTWRNIFLQSMKNNTLSVKILTKNWILRTLRQLYAVFEIIILIRWVTPPQNVENLQLSFSQFFEIPQLFFNLHCLHHFRRFSSTAFTYSYFFVLPFLLCECDQTLPPLCYTQSIHKFFMCVLFQTRSKSSLCPCQLKNLRTEL